METGFRANPSGAPGLLRNRLLTTGSLRSVAKALIRGSLSFKCLHFRKRAFKTTEPAVHQTEQQYQEQELVTTSACMASFFSSPSFSVIIAVGSFFDTTIN